MFPVSKCRYSRFPAEKGHFVFLSRLKNTFLFLLLLLPFLPAGNNKENIPSLVSFSWYAPQSSQTGKCQ